MTLYQFGACPRCHGDLYLTHGDWQCLHCGRHPYPPATPAALLPPPPPDSTLPHHANPLPNANTDADGFWDFWRRQAV